MQTNRKSKWKCDCNDGISGNVTCVSSGSYSTLTAEGQSQWCERPINHTSTHRTKHICSEHCGGGVVLFRVSEIQISWSYPADSEHPSSHWIRPCGPQNRQAGRADKSCHCWEAERPNTSDTLAVKDGIYNWNSKHFRRISYFSMN